MGEELSKANWKIYITLSMVVLLLVISMFQSFQIIELKKSGPTGNVLAGSSVQSAGAESYTDMMARMHPDQVAAQSQGTGSQMVGGC
ncbi:MAG: hypothetical protein HY362_04630 [Candidatus Aenigmarchaeota archaeon]|nr:hypothetical protein [Candidatus Aenigmarchaeota archaeon]